MQGTAYFDNDAYHNALDKLEAIARNFDPAAPDDLRTRFIEAVGDGFGVWPISCAQLGESEK